ncbi:MAG: carbon starvation protein A [Treponema sp.]|jgi:carbon starvation protein|nr:carbon starvation protein A [Treponema sp.]
MNGLDLLILAVTVLGLAYALYGRRLARSWGIDPARKTPAREFEDDMEFVPSSPAVVFGHEFASIAGAGPINGPIIAAMFGWVPVFLWLLFGAVFIGAVHDFAALYTSVRNGGKSIGYIIEIYAGKTGKRLFLIFVWFFSILIIGAFADIAAGTFAGFDPGGGGIKTNAQVASASLFFTAAAVGLGFLIRKKKTSGLASGIIAVDLLILCIVLGLFFPIFLPKGLWLVLVFGYICTASLVPVWSLGQPRNYLNSFLLIAMILAAFTGVVFTKPEISIPPFSGFEVNGNLLFPGLFITIACGAISGFHSLVAAGTVSKQIDNESRILPISYGAMLLETLVAVLALIAVGSLARNGVLPQGTPPLIFATAVSGFLHQLGLPGEVSFTIVSLAVSSFVFTTLDTVTRLGRLSFQELFARGDTQAPPGMPANSKDANPESAGSENAGSEDAGPESAGSGVSGNREKPAPVLPALSSPPFLSGPSSGPFLPALRRIMGAKPVSAFCTLLPAYLLAILGYRNIWALFGTANQLLAALSLLACALFLKQSRRGIAALAVPIFIMLAVSYSSLVLTVGTKTGLLIRGGFDPGADGLQLCIALALLILGVLVGFSCLAKLFSKTPKTVKGTAEEIS